VGAFLEAVDHFKTGPLQYTWPYFIPFDTKALFFKPTRDEIIQLLLTRPVLLSSKGKMIQPRNTQIVGPELRDEEGSLDFSDFIDLNQLSGSYPN